MKRRPQPYDDIPGTIIFDAQMGRIGYHLNQFAMSLRQEKNRKKFKSNVRAYLDQWPMNEEQKQAVLDRDYNRMMQLGGNIYFLAKIFLTDGLTFQYAASTMTGVSEEEYKQMMLNGGRSPQGNLYKK